MHPAELRRPALRGEDVVYYDAFRSLGASRSWGQSGPKPILISEVLCYLITEGITEQPEQAKYRRLVQSMDQVELAHIRAQMKKATK